MKIKFLKSAIPAGYSYLAGHKLNCDDKFGQKLIDLRFAEKIESSSDGQTFNLAPLIEWEKNNPIKKD